MLDPGWTNYRKRVLYSTYDVTPQIVSGRNCLGLMLGNGWYNPLPLKMWGFLNLRKNLPVGRPRAIAQLEIEFADGTRQIVATDETWQRGSRPDRPQQHLPGRNLRRPARIARLGSAGLQRRGVGQSRHRHRAGRDCCRPRCSRPSA